MVLENTTVLLNNSRLWCLFKIEKLKLINDDTVYWDKVCHIHFQKSMGWSLNFSTEWIKMELGTSCEVCGTSDAKRCVRCFEVAYCSKECQKKDWDAGHKVMCKIAQETRRTQRLKEWKSVPRFAQEYQSKYPKVRLSYTMISKFSTHVPNK